MNTAIRSVSLWSEAMANINDRIIVRLTDHGNSILDKYVAEQLEKVSFLNLPDSYTPYRADDEGYIKFTFWEFTNIFGGHFWNGGPQLLENNEIIFDVNKN